MNHLEIEDSVSRMEGLGCRNWVGDCWRLIGAVVFAVSDEIELLFLDSDNSNLFLKFPRYPFQI